MPIINIAVSGEPDAELSSELASEVTELTRLHLSKNPNLTAVAVS